MRFRSHAMSVPRARRAAAALAVFAALCLCGVRGAAAGPGKGSGPAVIFDERAGSDVVCVMVAVPVGSSCETPDTRGACHLIEHMVFDGSERYTREELSGWVDDVGGFLNAFTRKETTVYFLLVPSAHLERGVDVLSQMLFHSVFLPAELEKERKVILEEMRREADDPRSAGEREVERALYRGSELAEPVTGFPATIETMSERAVKAFYRRHYAASGMTVVFMGGFDPAAAKNLVREYFPAGPGASACGAAPEPRWTNEIAERIDGKGASGLDLLVPFPSAAESGFPAALLASRLLEGPDSPLAAKCAELSLPAPEVSLEMYRGFSALRIHVGASEASAAAYRRVSAILESLADWTPSRDEVAKARTALLSSEVYDREMYHFYVMSKGEAIALFGERYLSLFDGPLAGLSEKSCAAALKRAFRPLRFNGCLALDAPETGSGGGEPSEAPLIEILPNGCTVGALERPGSPVAAMHFLLKGRSCGEGASQSGLVETLVTLLESSRAGRELSRELDELGARVQFGDNPYVPQDDYLVSPAFAFVRLEAPAGAMREAAKLLVSHLLESELANEDLDEVKKVLAREVGMRSASPYYALRTATAAGLLANHPFGAPVFPAPGALMKVAIEELHSLRERVFAGGNIVATLVSPETPAAGCAALRELLAAVPFGPALDCPTLPAPAAASAVEKTTRKEGAYIAAGWFVRSPTAAGTASALVAGEILSRRMQLELREKRGLAYSIECGVVPLPGGSTVMAYLGTGAPRIDEARGALEAEVRGLRERPPDAAETEIAKSRLIGKRSRSELSSINKAYALGLDIYLGGAEAFRSTKSLIGAVSAEDAARAIESLSWDGALVIRLMPEAALAR